MAEDDMARVRVNKTVTVMPNQTSTVLYEKGWEGTAPRAHIEQIVGTGAGERVGEGSEANSDRSKPNETSGA